MTDSLEAIQQARKAFETEITVLAHDLAGPLGRIINCMHLIKDLLMMGEVNAIDQVVDIALSSANAQLNTVGVLAEVTRLMNGMRQATPRPISIHDALQKTLSETAPMLNESRATLEVHAPENFPLIMAEEEALRRMFFNLLDNALRHVPDGGRVTFKATTNGNMAEFWVTNNGKEIAPEDRERIFEKFYRVQGSAVRGKRGMGLGLTYVKLTAESFGGNITVEDNPDGGAAFCLRLPLQQG